MISVGLLSDQLWEAREEKRRLAAQDKIVGERIKEIEAQLLNAMQEQGIEGGKGHFATFSRSESFVPNVENWDLFYKYIEDNHYWHLLHRRPSAKGCEELFTKNGFIPGVIPFKQVSIRLTTRNDI